MNQKQRNSLLEEALALHKSFQHDEAERLYAKVRRECPRDFDAWFLSGAMAFQRGGHLEQAAELLEKARRLKPDSIECRLFLGMALADLGRHTEAEPHLSRALKKAPHQAEAWENLARCQQAIGNLADAVASMERFVSLQPANASAHEQLGELVAAANGFPAAEPHFRKALALDPSMAAAASNLGVSLIEQPGRIAEGMECFDKALQLDPFLTSASAARALGLMRLYKTEESLDLQNSILWMEPANTRVLSARNMLLNYPSSQDRHAIFEAHREFGTHFTDWEAPPFFNPPEPDKPLRVGFVSPDLRSHPVAAFLLPLLKHLDPSRIRIFLYHSHHTEDATSKALASHAVKWTNLNGLTDDLAAELIRKDAPDILIDLAGHSAMNRLPLFARYLAPVQLTYLGYPNTTGLPAITHRLVDSITDPEGEADTLSTERLIRFSPCAWAYEPPADAPEPRMPEPSQPITFACFNNFLKVSDATLATWAKLLDQCPGARLLLKSQYFDDPAVRESVTENSPPPASPPTAPTSSASSHPPQTISRPTTTSTSPWTPSPTTAPPPPAKRSGWACPSSHSPATATPPASASRSSPPQATPTGPSKRQMPTSPKPSNSPTPPPPSPSSAPPSEATLHKATSSTTPPKPPASNPPSAPPGKTGAPPKHRANQIPATFLADRPFFCRSAETAPPAQSAKIPPPSQKSRPVLDF